MAPKRFNKFQSRFKVGEGNPVLLVFGYIGILEAGIVFYSPVFPKSIDIIVQ